MSTQTDPWDFISPWNNSRRICIALRASWPTGGARAKAPVREVGREDPLPTGRSGSARESQPPRGRGGPGRAPNNTPAQRLFGATIQLLAKHGIPFSMDGLTVNVDLSGMDQADPRRVAFAADLAAITAEINRPGPSAVKRTE